LQDREPPRGGGAGRRRADAPAGLAEVERAKADGRWEAAYDGMATATVPEDLAGELEAAGVTERSRQAETRRRRIEKYVAMPAAGEKPHP
jgi:uncharacterized protein YdeI (YjbR/CyaY-like superfamily)